MLVHQDTALYRSSHNTEYRCAGTTSDRRVQSHGNCGGGGDGHGGRDASTPSVLNEACRALKLREAGISQYSTHAEARRNTRGAEKNGLGNGDSFVQAERLRSTKGEPPSSECECCSKDVVSAPPQFSAPPRETGLPRPSENQRFAGGSSFHHHCGGSGFTRGHTSSSVLPSYSRPFFIT